MRYTTTSSSLGTPLSRLAAVVCLFLSVLFMTSTIVGSGVVPATVVSYAEEEKSEEVMDKSLSDYKGEKNDKSFTEMMDKALGENDRNNFGYVLRRVFGVGYYLNETPTGYSAVKEKVTDKPKNCDLNDPYAGTPIYHNCDVPNMATEFVQMLTSILIPSGPQGAGATSAKVPFGLGIPSVLPGNKEVPVDPSKRTVKYTALELYGYSPHYTRYLGEWDNIKVMTSARLMTNFGAMDSLKATGNAIYQGVKGGMAGGARGAWDGVKSGSITKTVGGFFSGWAKGATTATANAILDTSDLNVFERWAWYRVGYGETLYNAREVSQIEFSWLMSQQYADLFGGSAEKADIPKNIQDTRNGPPALKDNVAKCEIIEADGKKTLIKSDLPEGVSKEECQSKANESPGSKMVWSIDGTAKGETLVEWETRNSALLNDMKQYGMTCTLDTKDEKNRVKNFEKFSTCWSEQWSKVAQSSRQSHQVMNDDTFFNKIFSFVNVFAKLTQPKRNFNAPWNRFVCLDSNGKDMLDDKGEVVFLYSPDKKLNPKCKAPRPPIQNGWYGNGYIGETPPVDTRYQLISHKTPLNIVLDPFGSYVNSSWLSDGFFKLTKLTTQVTIAVVDLSMSPVADTLGLKDTVVTMVESLRESVFFPLAVIVIAFSGVMLFFTTVKNHAYRKGFTDILLIIFTFVLGAVMMYRPEAVIDTADKIPTAIESTVAGAILEAAPESDELCTATQLSSSEDFNSRANIRNVECEIWRNFVFYPWVQGQWGASFDELYANGTPGKTTLKNTNGDLVGNASVNMGGGTTVNNWALYQLDVTSSGTSTTSDPKSRDGGTPRDFYRIVDAQAGPNNGAGTDGRYLHTWAGKEGGYRFGIAFMSFPVALVGLVTFLAMGVTKIILSLMFIIMFLMAPFMFLIGLHPYSGRRKLLQYGATMATYIVQRIVIVVLMSLMLLFLTMTTKQVDSYLLAALLTIVLCIGFRKKQKAILSHFAVSIGNATGGLMGQKSGDPTATIWGAMPKSIRNFGQEARVIATSTVGGAVAGFTVGGPSKAKASAQHSILTARKRLRTKQLRAGNLGMFTKFRTAADAGRRSSGVHELTASYNREKNAGNTGKYFKELNIMARENNELTEGSQVKIDMTDERSKSIINEVDALDAEAEKLEKEYLEGGDKKIKDPKELPKFTDGGTIEETKNQKKVVSSLKKNENRSKEYYKKKKEIAIKRAQAMQELYARNNKDIDYSDYHVKLMTEGAEVTYEKFDEKSGTVTTVTEKILLSIPELTAIEQMKRELDYARRDYKEATEDMKQAIGPNRRRWEPKPIEGGPE